MQTIATLATVAPTPEMVSAAQPVAPPTATSNADRWDGLLQKHFGNQWKNAKRVMLCESGGNPTAHNGNSKTGDDSFGLFQINRFGTLAKSRPIPALLVDAEFNIEYAANMQRSQGWSTPWSCARKLWID